MDVTPHKTKLQAYFDGEGFTRWQAIYGDAPLTGVRATIRKGHTQMLALALDWLELGSRVQGLGVRPAPEPRTLNPEPWCVFDAGCGTGLLTLALAQHGYAVTAIDIAPQMVAAVRAQAEANGVSAQVHASSGDLETITGEFDAVACLDVLIHYPAAMFAPMLTRLANMTRGPLVFTYAPYEPLLAALHWVGGHFPKAQRRTDIQMIRARFVEQTLATAGMRIRRTERISAGFYYVALVEAEQL